MVFYSEQDIEQLPAVKSLPSSSERRELGTGKSRQVSQILIKPPTQKCLLFISVGYLLMHPDPKLAYS